MDTPEEVEFSWGSMVQKPLDSRPSGQDNRSESHFPRAPNQLRLMRKPCPKGLAAKPHPGPKVRHTAEQLAELETLLLQGATKHGWPNVLWTAQRVAEMIRRHFGIPYHVEHVRTILRDPLRWSSQKPRKKAKQRNVEKTDH